MDPSSFAEPTATTKHLHWDISDLSFETNTITASASLVLNSSVDANPLAEVTLDTRNLQILAVHQAPLPASCIWPDVGLLGEALFNHAVEQVESTSLSSSTLTECAFTLGEHDPAFGSPLKISLATPVPPSTPFLVKISYKTSPACTAAQWLTAAQTASKTHPYLFTQCQAIHARSLLPCQDTPGVKATYSARVSVPEALTAVMSGLPSGAREVTDGRALHRFAQPVPVPSYLIALAVGNLVSKRVGPRSHVWSEPAMVEAAAWEFEGTERFIATAEDLVGPYVWRVFDLLVLPPSFPYGGMENPNLTFVTPTLLAGDRSLVGVVAHEISHSWSGNLVSCKNWEGFWLNEGWTVFLERKIIGRLQGEQARQFSSVIGWNAMKGSVEHFGSENPLTKLVLDLRGVDPDDSFSSIPYEKGKWTNDRLWLPPEGRSPLRCCN